MDEEQLLEDFGCVEASEEMSCPRVAPGNKINAMPRMKRVAKREQPERRTIR
jgi:hypothetical protein